MYRCINLYPQRVTYTQKKKKRRELEESKQKDISRKTHHERNQADNDDS